MFADGYVGTTEDANRIRRQEKQRQEQRKKFEQLAKAKHDQAETAGLRQFAATTSEVRGGPCARQGTQCGCAGVMRVPCGVCQGTGHAAPCCCPSLPNTNCLQALEHAFKNETVGLVSKAEFVKKRTTLQERWVRSRWQCGVEGACARAQQG